MQINENARFDGADYDHIRDYTRLEGQIFDIYLSIKDERWYTLAQIERGTGHPQASISAQLRNLRKPRFGGFVIKREHVKGGLYRYRIDLQAERKQEKPRSKVNPQGIEDFLRALKSDIDKTGETIIARKSLDYNLLCNLLGE